MSKWKWLLLAVPIVLFLEAASLMGETFPSRYMIPLSLLLIFGIGYETLWHGLQALFCFRWHKIQLLMVIAVAGAAALGKWEEAAIVIVLYTLAEKLEDLGIAHSRSALEALIAKMPRRVSVVGKQETFTVEEISLGEIISIRPGEMIPLDGYVQKGRSFVDESTITGEPIPKDKDVGDQVFAGTMNTQGYLEVEVSKTAQETTFAKIRQLTEQGMKQKAKTQQFIEQFSQIYTPALLLLALFWISVPVWVFQQPFLAQFQGALTLLVIACPCALVISTPISIYSAMGRASKEGILLKGGRVLEALGQLKLMAFDKTGTLTYGKPSVTDVQPFGSATEEELVACAAGLEAFSEHPLAQSIREHAANFELYVHAAENFEAVTGKGIKADCLVCDERHHCLGKLSFILEEHVVPEKAVSAVQGLEEEGKTVIILSTHKEIEGIIGLSDRVRPEVPQMIRTLQEMGLSVALLTGDNRTAAGAIANQLGIAMVGAELLPEEKAEKIRSWQVERGPVAMVGDGINDSPALAVASVGITMSELGSDMAIEAANAVLLRADFNLLPFLVRLGRRTLGIIRFNTLCAVSVKILFVILALFGMTTLALAILADVGVTLLVIANSLRLMR